jgi:hypothetical protein
MHRVLAISTCLFAGACTPQNAELTGDFTAFLSDVASVTLQRGDVKLDEFERRYAVDCRQFATARSDAEVEALRLNNRLPVCRGDVAEDGTVLGREDWPPPHERWVDDDGFVVVGDQFDPWRAEAIITSEGDVQLGFHQRLPGGKDFRFALVIDPDFQPRECAQSEDGQSVVFQEVDGDWVANWSEDLGDDEQGRLFYLNANSYQFNPAPNDGPGASAADQWFLPNEWMAGYSRGRFADDEFRSRPTRYAAPETYLAFQDAENSGDDGAVDYSSLFFCEWFGEEIDPNFEVFDACHAARIAEARTIAEEVEEEYALIGIPVDAAGLPSMKPRIHTNLWRDPDGHDAGLDGWTELHYSWVRFDPGAELETGGSATGEFQIVFDAFESPSRFFVRGSFKVDRFKRDTWTTAYLPAVKFEENGTEFCGTTVLPPSNF